MVAGFLLNPAVQALQSRRAIHFAAADPVAAIHVLALERRKTFVFYETRFTPGGCHVPSPAGKIEGEVGVGQYRRITR